ncbi:MAG TPA: hypothetical protein PKC50_10935, partial [Elusimicrobiota bacterium]|nr:hypothetical protein [Elusimicrobiota bacterium]
LRQGAAHARFPGMTVDRYLRAAGVAYDAVFKELRSLSPLDKYKKKADGRHGGMLDLPRRDAPAFARWYDGKARSGAHPWEIVFGHPHGIMLSPEHRKEEGSWGFALRVDSLGLYVSAARMAIALAAAKLPFEFAQSEEVIKALLGTDDVEVGPGLYEVHFQDLKRSRPDALSQIRWDPLHPITPILPDQRARVAGELKGGKIVR